MNCKGVEELLPLHIGGDLEEKRVRLVTAHVQSCSECAGLAAEYRQSQNLIQEFNPPPFSDAVFAEVRQNVLREIRQAPESSSLSLFIASLFRPRLRWAVTTAAMLAVVVLAFYFSAQWRDGAQNAQLLAGKEPGVSQPTAPAKTNDLGDRVKLALNAMASWAPKPTSNSSATKTRRLPRSARDIKSDVPVETALHLRKEPKAPSPATTATLEKIVRLEIQTKDPNIRIIWFTHQPEEGLPSESSKGL